MPRRFWNDANTGEMPLTGHLEEFRKRLIWGIAPVLPIAVILFAYNHAVLQFFLAPIHPYAAHLVFLSPQEALFTYIKLAVVLALILASPLWLYQMLAFIMPALTPIERKAVLPLLPIVVILFVGGACFGFFIFLPFVLHVLIGFDRSALTPMITLGNYISFLMTVTVPFGFIFELPALTHVLARVGIISSAFMRRQRRIAVFAAVVLAGAFAPPDAMSMLIMAVPILALYEASIWVAWLTEKARARDLARQAPPEE